MAPEYLMVLQLASTCLQPLPTMLAESTRRGSLSAPKVIPQQTTRGYPGDVFGLPSYMATGSTRSHLCLSSEGAEAPMSVAVVHWNLFPDLAYRHQIVELGKLF